MKFLKEIFKKPITICFTIIICIIMGVVSTTKMAVNLLPNIALPYLGVITTYVGASAKEMEDQVALPISQQLSSISELKEVESYSMDNASIFVLQFNYGTDIEKIEDKVNEAIKNASLPSECTYQITNVDLNQTAVSTLSMYTTSDNIDTIYNDAIKLKEELISINGVGSIDIVGAPNPVIKITPFNGLEMSTLLIMQQLLTYEQMDIPLGEIIENGESISISNDSSITSIEDIKNLSLNLKLNEETIASLENIRKLLNSISQITTNNLDSIKEPTLQMNYLISFLNNASDENLDQILLLKNLITLCDSKTSIELTQLKTLLPLITYFTDEQLQEIAINNNIDYQVMLYIKNNVDLVSSLLDQIITYKTENQDNPLTNEQYANVLYREEIIDTSLLTKEDFTNLIGFVRGVDQVVLESVITSLKNNQEVTNQQYIDLFKLESTNPLIDNDKMITLIRDVNYPHNFQTLYSFKENHQTLDENNNLVGLELTTSDLITLFDNLKLENILDIKITKDLLDFINNVQLDKDTLRCKVKDIAEVYTTYQYNTSSKYNDVNSFQLLIYANSGSNATQIVEEVEKVINSYNTNHSDSEIIMLDNQAKFINDSLSNAISSLIIGGILAILVIYLFLRKIPSSLIIAISMPLSILCTLICLHLLGITLNMISVGGIAVGIGMLVDNSIVVLESISSEREKGKNALESSVDGVKLVLSSLIGSTLTSICVFFPILLMDGLTKEIFSDLSWAVILSLSFSLIVAVLVIPTLYCLVYKNSYQKKEKTTKGFMDKLTNWYEKVLSKSLKHKVIVIVSCLVVFISSIGLVFVSSKEFLPAIDERKIQLTVNFSPNYKFNECQEKALQAYELINDNVDNISYTALNVSKQGLIATNISATILIQLDNKAKDTSDVAQDIRNLFNEQYDLPISVLEIDGVVATLTNGMAGVSVSIKGEDNEILKEIAEKVKVEILKHEGIENVTDDYSGEVKSLKLHFDSEKLNQYGIDYQTLVTTLKVGISSYDIASLKINDLDYTINVSFNDNFYNYYDSILDYIVSFDDEGNPIRLSEVATVSEVTSPSVIKKINGENTLTITLETYGLDTNTASQILNNAVKKELKNYPGYSFVSSGVSFYLEDAFSGLVVALIISFFLLFGVMACLFESIKKPLIIILSFPFAFTGGFIALFITGASLNVVSFIGLIMLMGVIVNEAIILIERYDQIEKTNVKRQEAILIGSKQRLRAILMTTMTTVLALIPMAIGIGKGGALMKPMGIIAIGGLVVGSLVTLIIIPVIYDLFTKKEKK